MELNVNELLYMARCNDPKAYLLLQRKFSPFVMRAYKKLHSKIPTLDYEEIEQVMTVGICNAVYHYRSDKDAAFSSFVVLCMQREAQNYAKRYIKNYIIDDNFILSLDAPSVIEENTNLYDIVPGKSNDDPASSAYASLLFQQIEQQLNNRERMVLNDRIVGYSNNEICQRRKLKYKQVDNAIQSIRKKAKTFL